MPNLDKTGPTGQGPRTGRGLGDCEGSGDQYPTFPMRRGFECGFRRFWAPSKNNLEDLKAIEKQLSTELKELREEIARAEN